MLMRRDWSRHVDRLRDDIWQNHSAIHIVDFDFYNIHAFNKAVKDNVPIMAIDGWENIHPLLKIVPVEWEYQIPFGIMYSPNPTKQVESFIKTIQNITD